jgi:hypothetical protein
MTMLKFPFRQAALLSLLLILVTPAAFAGSSFQAGEWLVLDPAGEGFSIKIPVKPEVETQRVPMMGNTYQLRLYTLTDQTNGLLYMVIMQEFPSLTGMLGPTARLEKFMDGFKKGLGESLATAVGGKFGMVVDRDLSWGSNPGRQYNLTVGETRGLVRAFDGGRRVYLLPVLGADEKKSEVVRFFDSFEIKAAPDPIPQPVVDTKSP